MESVGRFVATLDPADLSEVELLAVEVMAAIFVGVESSPSGSCFDVLVQEAIERGERRLQELPDGRDVRRVVPEADDP